MRVSESKKQYVSQSQYYYNVSVHKNTRMSQLSLWPVQRTEVEKSND